MKIVILFLLFFNSVNLLAHWQIPIRNYQQKEYQAGTQNWKIKIQKNGWIYFANNYGLLEFDGEKWNTYGMWNSNVVYSLDIDDNGTIYVGGTNEFGKLERSTNGH